MWLCDCGALLNNGWANGSFQFLYTYDAVLLYESKEELVKFVGHFYVVFWRRMLKLDFCNSKILIFERGYHSAISLGYKRIKSCE